MSSANPTDLVLRPADRDDAMSVVAVHLASRGAAVDSGAMPPGIHPDHEVGSWLEARLACDEVWVAEAHGDVVAYLRLSEEWLDDLYVAPALARRGIGAALLEIAKVRRPRGFGLWVFETNQPARDFYARHDLVEVERTDGSDNEEHSPDIRMVWRP